MGPARRRGRRTFWAEVEGVQWGRSMMVCAWGLTVASTTPLRTLLGGCTRLWQRQVTGPVPAGCEVGWQHCHGNQQHPRSRRKRRKGRKSRPVCPTMGFEHQERKEQPKPTGSVGILGAWCPQSPGCRGGQVQPSSLSNTPVNDNPF